MILNIPKLFYGSESWTVRRTDGRILIAEMCSVRRPVHTAFQSIKNEHILRQVKVLQTQ
jgi:hypothetical protein